MKILKFLSLIILVSLSLQACDEYLDKTPDAEVTDEDIFGTYPSFQGFVDILYSKILDHNSHTIVSTMNIGGDVISIIGWATGNKGNNGDYWNILNREYISNADGWPTGSDGSGYYTDGWRGIRISNLALEYLPLLVNASEEERMLIEGQAYFFRAFFHFELIKSFGGLPYIDKLLLSDDPMNYPRLSYHEATEKVVADFTKAAELLPAHWDLTSIGSLRPGANTGRATKGAALAFKAKALLYAGSPLMNKFSGFDYTYNKPYMERAAETAWEVIKMAEQDAVYSMVHFSNYRDNFAKTDGSMPWTTETIFQKSKLERGIAQMTVRHGRVFSPARFGGNANTETVNQLFIDRFEMADGTRYKPEYDHIDSLRWENRDPRFRQNILVDRDKWGNHANTALKLYVGGTSDKNAQQGISTPYVIKKFWPFGVNSYDGISPNFRYVTPYMRLAEVYLIYAEAANEAYGANGSVPGSGLSAVQAINKVRQRPGLDMPPVTADATGYESFRELIWNERSVELCFEANYWFDIRRWYVAHNQEYKEIVDLAFDQNWTTFNRSVIKQRVFDDPKHYWMPLPRNQTMLYKEYYQNPGW
jgi:starch-binding outer membrane protein, SusD/RagB family